MARERNKEPKNVKKTLSCSGRRTILGKILFTLLVVAIVKTEALRITRTPVSPTDSESELEGYHYDKPREGLKRLDVQYNKPLPQKKEPLPPKKEPEPQRKVPEPPKKEPEPQKKVPEPQRKVPLPQRKVPEPQRKVPEPQRKVPLPPKKEPLPQRKVPEPQRKVTLPPKKDPLPQKKEPLPPKKEPLPQIIEPLPPINEPLPQIYEPLPQINEPLPQIYEPLPQNNEPLPQINEPLPQDIEPLPQDIEPLPQNNEPYPQINEPYPQEIEPLPQNNEPEPQINEPLPQEIEPLPQNYEPEPQINEPLPQEIEPLPQDIEPLPQDNEQYPQYYEQYPQDNEQYPQDNEPLPQDIEPLPQDIEPLPQDNEQYPQYYEQYPQDNEQYPQDNEQYPQDNEQYPQDNEQYTQNNEQYEVDDGICHTAGCIKAANQVLDSIDESINPCDNFYDFACGKFVKNTPLPPDKETVDSFSMVRDLVQDQLKTIFDVPVMPNDPKAYKAAKDFYNSCLNESIIEGNGNKAMTDLLEDFGGWPVVKGDSWNETDFNWFETLKKFRMVGLSHAILFTLNVQTDKIDSMKRVIDIDRTTLELESEYLAKGFQGKEVQAYYKYMVDNAVIVGADRGRAEQELRESLEFERKLAEISKKKSASAIYKPTTIKDLQKSYPFMNWLEFIMAMLPNGTNVDENQLVTNSAPEFYGKLGQLLASTPKRTIANYMLWRIVGMTSGTQSEQLRQLKFQFYKDVYGLAVREERWKECITFTAMSMPIAVGSLYVRKYFPKKSKEVAISMVTDIQEEFLMILRTSEWMDEGTRSEAIKKAEALATHIAYPEELIQDDKLEELYKGLEIVPDNLLNNTLQLKKHTTDYQYGKLHEPIDRTDWVTHAKSALVNAYYTARENSILVPAAILQERFFDADRPRYMNYPAIGQVIGHEITHGFDNKGRQFDASGNFHDWWEPNTKKQFLAKAQCMIEQYGNYTDRQTMLMLNGKSTQGENIADNGGTLEAYYAYNNWLKHNDPEKKLPGVKYNQQQLFWISSAQIWCAVSTDDFIKKQIKTGVHSPNEFRVNGVVSNMFEFANDFMCPLGAPMNPENKCKVW